MQLLLDRAMLFIRSPGGRIRSWGSVQFEHAVQRRRPVAGVAATQCSRWANASQPSDILALLSDCIYQRRSSPLQPLQVDACPTAPGVAPAGVAATAVQQDGRSASLTAPNGLAQARLLEAVHAGAGSTSHGLSPFEAHATGTPLGDPIEMGAIVKAALPFAVAGILSVNCAKANFAHSETGAGDSAMCLHVPPCGSPRAVP